MKPPTKTKIIDGKTACFLGWSDFWYTLIDQKPYFWDNKYAKWKPSRDEQIRNIILKYFIENNLIQPIQPKTNNKMTAKTIKHLIHQGGTDALVKVIEDQYNKLGGYATSCSKHNIGHMSPDSQTEYRLGQLASLKYTISEINTLEKALEKHTAE